MITRIKDIPSWGKLSWENKYVYLSGFFTSGGIKDASRHELEDMLIVLANANPSGLPGADYQSQIERQAVVIRHLLQVRLTEDLQCRSFWLSIAALAVSVVAIFISAFKVVHP